MCLMKEKENQPCLHAWCRMAAKKPEYFALFKADYIMNHTGVQTFKMFATPTDGKPYILPVNPYERGVSDRNSFELFRQAEQTFTEVIGDWPLDRSEFDKSEIDFVLIEEYVSIPTNRCVNDGSPWVDIRDLKEVAIYCGTVTSSEKGGASC